MRKGLEPVLGKPYRRKPLLLQPYITAQRESQAPRGSCASLDGTLSSHSASASPLQTSPPPRSQLGEDGGNMLSAEVQQQGDDLFQLTPAAAALHCAGEIGLDSCRGRAPGQRSSVSAKTLISAFRSQELGAGWQPGPWQWWCVNMTRNSPPSCTACRSLHSQKQSLLYFCCVKPGLFSGGLIQHFRLCWEFVG